MTKEELIEKFVEGNFTIIQAQKYVRSETKFSTKDIRFKDILKYNKEFILELPENKYYEVIDQRAYEYMNELIADDPNLGFFATDYDCNNTITIKNILSYYIKFIKFGS